MYLRAFCDLETPWCIHVVATLRIADLVWDSSGWPVPVGP